MDPEVEIQELEACKDFVAERTMQFEAKYKGLVPKSTLQQYFEVQYWKNRCFELLLLTSGD